jgi:hypothetical protein
MTRHALDHLHDLARAIASESVLRHHVHPAAGRAEGNEAAIASGMLHRQLHGLGQQPFHVRGVAEQAVGLVERAELVGRRERDRHVLALDLAAQAPGRDPRRLRPPLVQPHLRLLEMRERLIEALALGLRAAPCVR